MSEILSGKMEQHRIRIQQRKVARTFRVVGGSLLFTSLVAMYYVIFFVRPYVKEHNPSGQGFTWIMIIYLTLTALVGAYFLFSDWRTEKNSR
jgi:hypothetical protein